jgi:hypothetical protein
MDKSAFGYIVEMFMSICQVLQEHIDPYDAHKSTRHTQFLITSQQVNYCQAVNHKPRHLIISTTNPSHWQVKRTAGQNHHHDIYNAGDQSMCLYVCGNATEA